VTLTAAVCSCRNLWQENYLSKYLLKKLILAVIIVLVTILFWRFDLGHYFTLSYLKGSLDGLKSLYTQRSAMAVLVYFLIYVGATALWLPGALVLTIGAGALFGFLAGTLIVSFASTIGATLACSIARFVLRDWVQRKLGDKIAKINKGIEEEGAFYLFTLRLIPVFPFWMINLAMGLTRMSLWRFYWVSQLGMLAGTMVYVNAGKEIAKIESLQGILSPRLLASFILLGILPLGTKRLLALYRKRWRVVAVENDS
jgi:uncharacterized membrane protein YdjX (TVP38/TMEM64 family)